MKVFLVADLKNKILLDLIDLSSQAAVGDGVDDDWLVGLRAWFFKKFRTFFKTHKKRK